MNKNMVICVIAVSFMLAAGDITLAKKSLLKQNEKHLSASALAVCPVDRITFDASKLDPKQKFVYKGRAYYFDSAGCVLEFKKHPEKYTHKK